MTSFHLDPSARPTAKIRGEQLLEVASALRATHPPQDASALQPGVVVASYRIVRMLGRGGMGEVYLARDVGLGRKVALKVIRPGAIGDQGAVAKFLREARITAGFNHPHIVTVYGAGQWEGRPYVALEYLEGQTLRERMVEQRLGLRETVRLGIAIAEALGEAHRNHVLHRDLKPENVFLPRDGRVRVVDFGLAQRWSAPDTASATSDHDTDDRDGPDSGRADSDEGLIVGTPDYMAPEQWKGLLCTPATDVWALGLLLYELLTGRLPHPTGSYLAPFTSVCSADPVPRMAPFEPLPHELERLVYQCLEKEPESRPSAEDVASGLHNLLYPQRGRGVGEDCPFRGLLPFSEEHADVFYGRDSEVASFIEKLRVQPLLPIVGPSGAGKTSFVQAGVVPRLREKGRWIVLHVRPGRQPFDAVAPRLVRGERTGSVQMAPVAPERPSSLGDLTEANQPLSSELGANPSLLGMKLRHLSEQEDAWVLLVVDQMEEVYTLVSDPEIRSQFMRAVCAAADDPQTRVRVVMTLRDDFIVRLAETEQAREALGNVTVLRGPGPDALREILEKPVSRAGYRYEDPGIVDDMISALGHELASLPLIQVAVTQMWEERDRTRRVLRRDAYDAMGGVAGALARQVDGVLVGLSPTQHGLARELLMRLVTPERTRRVVPQDQLLEGLGEGAAEVLSRLVAGRAVVVRRGRGSGADGDVELVHESLIRNWTRLARWIDESREEMAFLAEVGQAAELWEKRGEPAEEVWRGPALQQALSKASRVGVLPDRVRRFLAAGERLERRRSRLRRAVAAGAFLLLGSVAAMLAWQGNEARRQRNAAHEQRTLAEEERRLAEHNAAEALREGAAAALFREDIVEARAKIRLALESEDSPSIRALWSQISSSPLRGIVSVPSRAWTAAFMPDHRKVAALDVQGNVHVIDADTTSHRRIASPSVAQVAQASFSDDGARLVAADATGEIRIWDLRTETLKRVAKAPQDANWFSLSPDGAIVASAHGDGTVHLFDVPSGQELRVLPGHRLGASRTAFSPDGAVIAVGSTGGTIHVWDVPTGRAIRVMNAHDKLVGYVAFSPDGRQIVSCGWDGAVRLWDVATGRLLHSLVGHSSAVFRARFSPDGKLLASVSGDKTVRVWDARSGTLIRTLRGHADQVFDVDFSADGKTLLSLDGLGVIRLWNVDASATPARREGHEGSLFGIDFSPDGSTVASASRDGTVRLWSTRDGTVESVLRGHEAGVLGVSFSPDGRQVVTGGNDHTVRVWDLSTGATIRVLNGHADAVVRAAFSPDGGRVVSASNDGTARVWDVAHGGNEIVLRGHGSGVNQAVFSPDGKTIATGGDDGSIRLWDARTGPAKKVIEAHPAAVYGPRFSPDGRQIVSGGWDGAVRVGALDGSGRVVVRCEGYAFYAAFDPGAARVAAPCSDGNAIVVDLSGGAPIRLEGHVGHVTDARFSPDGKLIATAGDDATVRLWDSATGRPAWYSVLLRTAPAEVLTHRGWEPLAGDGQAPDAPTQRWRSALQADGRSAEEHPSSGTLCVSTWQSTLDLWDTREDRRLWSKPRQTAALVTASAGGCIVLGAHGDLAYVTREGQERVVEEQATAFSLQQGRLLVAATGRISEIDLTTSAPAYRFAFAAETVTAVARVGRWIALGRPDGDIDLVPADPAGEQASVSLAGGVPAAVVRLEPGPHGTVAAGFGDGTVGVWDPGNGARIASTRLHGRVTSLRVLEDRVVAVSDLGDHVVLDLSVLGRAYCDLLGEVWRDVPTVWRGGRAVEAGPPSNHRCRKGP